MGCRASSIRCMDDARAVLKSDWRESIGAVLVWLTGEEV